MTNEQTTPAIKGYRTLTDEELKLVNNLKDLGETLRQAIEMVEPLTDPRALAIAKTHLQTGMMWLVRSITQPTGF